MSTAVNTKQFDTAGHTISFRSIDDNDMPFLARLYASTRQAELAVIDWSDQQKHEFLQMQFAAQHSHYQQHYSDAAFEIILCDDQLAGRLYVQRRDDEIRVVDIALLPEFRGRGIGGKLMQDLIDEARAGDIPVRIHVEQNNPAMRLYQRLGFEKIEEAGIYYLMQWKRD